MNDFMDGAATSYDPKKNLLTFTTNPKFTGQLSVHRDPANKMTLDGAMGGRKVHIELTLVDRNSFLIVSRGFHWVQDYPFNR